MRHATQPRKPIVSKKCTRFRRNDVLQWMQICLPLRPCGRPRAGEAAGRVTACRPSAVRVAQVPDRAQARKSVRIRATGARPKSATECRNCLTLFNFRNSLQNHSKEITHDRTLRFSRFAVEVVLRRRHGTAGRPRPASPRRRGSSPRHDAALVRRRHHLRERDRLPSRSRIAPPPPPGAQAPCLARRSVAEYRATKTRTPP